MEFVMKSGGIPVGNYQAEFISAEPFEDNNDKYGPGVLLRWRVIGGDHADEETSRIASAKLSPKSALGKLAVQLKGSKIESGERFQFDDFVGVKGLINVEETESGGTRVVTFLRSS
jgi:hypothetical protein